MADSIPRLSDLARHVVYPPDIVTTAWPRVVETCRSMGVEFDPWQHSVGALALGKRADGTYASTVGGITLSIPRQVGKTYLVGMTLVALCVLYPNLTVIWTAHRVRTATRTFQTLAGIVKRPRIRPHLKANRSEGIRSANGEQEIQFRNGSTILFGAREQGFGRGFDTVDVEVFDEAQILTEKALEDMVPAANASTHPAGALLFFMGTPPRPNDPGEEFSARRAKALAGKLTNGVYVEMSADAGADPDDRRQWAIANPSYPRRTPLESMERMRENLTDVDSFRREGLGVWDEIQTRAASVIEGDAWSALIGEAPETGSVYYGVKFSPDGLTVALSVALVGDNWTHVEGVEHRPMIDGTGWLVDWLASRARTAGAIVVDGKSGAGALVRTLEARGVPRRRLIVPTTDQAVSAHALFVAAVSDGALTHLDDEVLAASVASAGRRKIGASGGWGFQSIDGGDVTLIESIVFAFYGASSSRPARPITTGRKVVVL